MVSRISESSAKRRGDRLHGDAVATRLSVASKSLAREFGQRVDELVDRVETSARGISDTVVAYGDGLASRLDSAADRLHESVVVRGQTLEDALVAANVRLERRCRARPMTRARCSNRSAPPGPSTSTPATRSCAA